MLGLTLAPGVEDLGVNLITGSPLRYLGKEEESKKVRDKLKTTPRNNLSRKPSIHSSQKCIPPHS
jgi:hypothetical protein